jgi:hypothetical protein
VVVTGGGEGGGTSCASPPPPAQHALLVDGPGSIVGGLVHVTGTLDGEPGYFVGALTPDALWLGSSSLEGSPRWAAVDHRYARVAASDDGIAVELLDATIPEVPAITATFAVEGELPAIATTAYSGVAGAVIFCRALGDDPGGLVALDPLDGTVATLPASGACGQAFDHIEAAGPLFFRWTDGGDPTGGSVGVTDVATQSSLVSFGFATSGLHDYGPILGMASDGRRVVVSPTNDDWMLLFDDEGNWGPGGPYASFAPAGPKRLIAVVDEAAYFAVPTGVRAYDVSDVGQPALLEAQATIAWDPTAITFVAATPEALLVHDDTGTLLRVPRAITAAVEPVTVHLGEPPIDPCID